MSGAKRQAVRVCAADELVDGGPGVRRAARYLDGDAVVFFVRYDGQVHGYLNRCAHVPMELDWVEGQFFDSSGLYLMCATHGAIYAPESGRCVGGPCRGRLLQGGWQNGRILPRRIGDSCGSKSRARWRCHAPAQVVD